ncbi:hypothetical protein H5410_005467 [Solanum commersonii]|uniref:Uncharacterized protein n=1 Tax=Solanum commersonii TaxID=4109 RepID=A0A9J6A6U1_SOLCO|nr:hypothetical protein H5410_005467 [Solanum commersonii]
MGPLLYPSPPEYRASLGMSRSRIDSSKFLSQCLIGIFNDPFHSSPNTHAIRKWFLNRWKITAGSKSLLSHNQLIRNAFTHERRGLWRENGFGMVEN